MRVGVPTSLFGLPTETGRGRMWHEVLTRLERDVTIMPLADEQRSRFARRVRPLDVVLYDGHLGPRPESVPHVIQFHEAPWANPETMRTLDPSFLAPVVGPSQASADVASAVVCPSASARDEIVSYHGVAPERVVVAHHGVDHDTFHPAAPGGTGSVQAHGGDLERPWILFVGALHPRKGIDVVRDAFGRLVAEGLPHQLVIVGGPAHGRPDAEELQAQYLAPIDGAAGRLVSVPFGCSDAELAGLMAGASVFCLPSLNEGFGLPLAEAAACGTPAVAARRGSIPEIVGPGGLLTEPVVDEVVDALRRVCTDTAFATQLGQAAIQHAQSFTWDDCARRWREALDLAGKLPRPAGDSGPAGSPITERHLPQR